MEVLNSLIANKFKISEDLGFELNEEMKSLSFQGLFAYLRKSLEVNYTRKLHIDSILKKCKGKFFKAVSECVRKCIKINVPKFPQSFITNIAIEYNQQFLNYTVEDLYQYFHLLPYSTDDILEKNYCVQEKRVYLKYIFLSKISIKIAKLYQFVSDNFINYYLFSKAHMKKNNLLTDESKQNLNKDGINNSDVITDKKNNSTEEKKFQAYK